MWTKSAIEGFKHWDWPPIREFHEAIGSTNDRARELLLAKVELPAVVVAGRQESGRGRLGRTWVSPPGCLAFSLATRLEDMDCSDMHAPPLALWSGLGVADALVNLEPTLPVWLKWPNDLMVGDAKLGGILVEQIPLSGSRSGWVIGIGLNINNETPTTMPGQGATTHYRPVSLRELTNRTFPLAEVLRIVLQSLRRACAEFSEEPQRLPNRWAGYCGLQGKRIRVSSDVAQLSEGICCGVASDGALRIQTASGTVVSMRSGSVVDW